MNSNHQWLFLKRFSDELIRNEHSHHKIVINLLRETCSQSCKEYFSLAIVCTMSTAVAPVTMLPSFYQCKKSLGLLLYICTNSSWYLVLCTWFLNITWDNLHTQDWSHPSQCITYLSYNKMRWVLSLLVHGVKVEWHWLVVVS